MFTLTKYTVEEEHGYRPCVIAIGCPKWIARYVVNNLPDGHYQAFCDALDDDLNDIAEITGIDVKVTIKRPGRKSNFHRKLISNDVHKNQSGTVNF